MCLHWRITGNDFEAGLWEVRHPHLSYSLDDPNIPYVAERHARQIKDYQHSAKLPQGSLKDAVRHFNGSVTCMPAWPATNILGVEPKVYCVTLYCALCTVYCVLTDCARTDRNIVSRKAT